MCKARSPVPVQYQSRQDPAASSVHGLGLPAHVGDREGVLWVLLPLPSPRALPCRTASQGLGTDPI